jgi:hypothetical protein
LQSLIKRGVADCLAVPLPSSATAMHTYQVWLANLQSLIQPRWPGIFFHQRIKNKRTNPASKPFKQL